MLANKKLRTWISEASRMGVLHAMVLALLLGGLMLISARTALACPDMGSGDPGTNDTVGDCSDSSDDGYDGENADDPCDDGDGGDSSDATCQDTFAEPVAVGAMLVIDRFPVLEVPTKALVERYGELVAGQVAVLINGGQYRRAAELLGMGAEGIRSMNKVWAQSHGKGYIVYGGARPPKPTGSSTAFVKRNKKRRSYTNIIPSQPSVPGVFQMTYDSGFTSKTTTPLPDIQGSRIAIDNFTSMVRFNTQTGSYDYVPGATNKRSFQLVHSVVSGNDVYTYSGPADSHLVMTHHGATPGTATSGNTTYLAPKVDHAAGSLVGDVISFASGPNAGQTRTITSNSAGRIEWGAALSNSVGQNDNYEIIASRSNYVADSGTDTSVTQNNAAFRDEMKGCEIEFTSGSLIGTRRVITAVTPATLSWDDPIVGNASGGFKILDKVQIDRDGRSLLFAGQNSNYSTKGVMQEIHDAYDANVLKFNFNDTLTSGRIQSMTTSQNWQVQYTYIQSGTLAGKISYADLKQPIDSTTYNYLERTRYTYFLSSMGYSADAGTDGDLLMVEVLKKASTDSLTGNSDSDFSIRRYSLYRYYKGDPTTPGTGDADGRDHQMKAVLEPEKVELLMSRHSGITDPAQLLAKDDSSPLETGSTETVLTYASRTFKYNIADVDTSAVPTAWNGGSNENLNTKYGGSNCVDTGFAKSETVNGNCGTCGGTGETGFTRNLYALNLNGGSSSDPSVIVRITIEDIVDSLGNFKHRNIYGLNTDGVALRKARAVGSIGSPVYLCTSRKIGNDPNIPGSFKKITEERLASAHAALVTNDAQLRDFLSAAASSGNEVSLSDSSGVIYVHEYDADGNVTGELIKKGETGTAYYISASDYGVGSANQPKHWKTVAYTYPQQTTDRADSSRLATTFAYTFYDTACTQLQTITTTLPAVSTDHNGSGSSAVLKIYYDTSGRRRWEKDASGVVTYYAQNPDTGGIAYQMTDVNTDNLSNLGDITNGSTGKWIAWGNGGIPTGFGSSATNNLQLVSKKEYDALGRKTLDQTADGTVTLYTYQNEKSLVFPSWKSSTNTPRLPIQVTETDAADRVTAKYTVDPAQTTIGVNGFPCLASGTSPSNWYTLTRYHFNDQGQWVQTDEYFNIPTSGDDPSGQNHYQTTCAYDGGNIYKVVSPDGTIRYTVYDALGRVSQEWIGTNDVDGTPTSPHSSTSGNNMTLVKETFYDGALDSTLIIGDGTVTMTRERASDNEADILATMNLYDWRGRLLRTLAPDGTMKVFDLDWQGVVYEQRTYGGVDASELPNGLNTFSNRLLAETDIQNDELGRPYRRIMHELGSGGTVFNKLTSNAWYDASGRVIKAANPNGLFSKTTYDNAGRPIVEYKCFDSDDTEGGSAYAGAGSISGDTIISKRESSYSSVGLTLVADYRRNDNASGPGDLTTSNARRQYVSFWYDDAARLSETVFSGTNDPPSSAPNPNSSDNYIVTKYDYDSAGRQYKVTDNKGIITQTSSDALGRTTKKIENYVDGSVGNTEYASDRTTEYVYDSAGHLSTLRAKNPKGDSVENQETRYVYDSTAATASPAAYRNDLVTAVIYPDSDDSYNANGTAGQKISNGNDNTYDRVEFTYDRLGRKLTAKDQRGTTHAYEYDPVGRLTADGVTALGGADGAVQRIEYSYDFLGRLMVATSFDGNYSIVSEMYRIYNKYGTVAKSWQDHDTSTTRSGSNQSPHLTYTYGDGTTTSPDQEATYIRLQQVTYPSGRNVYYNYPSSSADPVGAALSRLDNIADSSAGTTKYAQYTYLGASTVVKVAHPGVTPGGLNLLFGTGGTYGGFDSLGRVVDQKWQDDSSTLKDEFQYAYDRNSNRYYKHISLTTGKDDWYGYDNLNRLNSRIYDGTVDTTTPSPGTCNGYEGFYYDALGNWRQLSDAGSGYMAQNFTFNAANEITGSASPSNPPFPQWVTPTCDAAGNMISGPRAGGNNDGTTRLHYIYDAWNRLVAVNSDDGNSTPIATYKYDGLHRMIRKTDKTGASNVTWDYYYNEKWQVVEERKNGSTSPYAQYVWDIRYVDTPVVRFRDADGNSSNGMEETLYYTTDANMNVTALVGTDGSVVERYTYDPYGAVQVLDGNWATVSGNASNYDNQILYCGYHFDPLSGLYHVRHRAYHSRLGKWMQRDLLGYIDGANLSQYVRSSPISHLDRWGLCDEEEDRETMEEQLDLFAKGLEGWIDAIFGPPEPVFGEGGTPEEENTRADNASEIIDDNIGIGDGVPLVPTYQLSPEDQALLSAETTGMGGRVLSPAEQAEFEAFAAQARALGFVQSPYRTGSWGWWENGKFVEYTRIDVGEAGMPGFRGQTHIHITGTDGHLDPSTKLPGEQ